MKERTPDLKTALRVWWAYTWRVAVFVGIPAKLLGGAIFFFRLTGAPAKLFIFGFIAYMIWVQVEIFRRILAMDFGSFTVRVERAD